MRIYIKNQQRLIKVDQHRIRRDLRKALHLLSLHKAEISVLFVNDKRMKILNSQYRGIERTTDVLSFPQHSPKEQKCRRSEVFNTGTSELQSFRASELLLGDIVINLHQAKRQAVEHNLTFNEELRLLLIHGLLHLVGHDHEKGGYDRRKMQKKTQKLLEKLQEN
jgi:probable rRNA maturation factor